MAFGYAFVDLNEAQKIRRRELLSLYPLIAQLSVLVVLAGVQLYFFASWATRKFYTGDEESRPSSPYVKHSRNEGRSRVIGRARKGWTLWTWWLGERAEIFSVDFGSNGEWVCGGIWMAWMLLLSFKDTGDDYLHLTKRLGVIGASQLPLHYLLAMKSPYSPLQMLTRLSHEQLNKAHQVLGRIIQTLLTLHAALYLNFYVQKNLLAKRTKDLDVIIGLTGIALFTLIGTTALRPIRRWNYRLFYTLHIAIATALLPLMYFHVIYIRPYILESSAIVLTHLLLRYCGTKTHAGTISMIAGTNLIKVEVPLASGASTYKPGQHIYLRLPGSSALRSNPFTVASVPSVDGTVTLIARTLRGSTTRLATLARSSTTKISDGITHPDTDTDIKPAPLQGLRLEGPYGSSSRLRDFTHYDRVLLIAGGVGGTYIIPIWRHILESRSKGETLPPSSTDVRLVWAVRTLQETSWAFPLPEALSAGKRAVSADDEAEIYITGPAPKARDSRASARSSNGHAEHIELAEREDLSKERLALPSEKELVDAGVTLKHYRPVLREIVDEVFAGLVERVAVLVCGPPGMGKQARRSVGRWVRKGKEVFWHDEEFGL